MPKLKKKTTKSYADRGAALKVGGRRMNPRARELAQFRHQFILRGRLRINPRHATSHEIKQFMWAGLRVLRSEAKSRGMSDQQVRRLLNTAFDIFDDAAESVWTSLRSIISTERSALPATPPEESFIACEEDRPTLLAMRRRRPLELRDPDEELLSMYDK